MLFHYNIDRAVKYALFKNYIYDNIKCDVMPTQVSGFQNELIVNKHFAFIQIPKTSSTNVLRQCRKHNLTCEHYCYRHEGLPYLEHFISKSLPIYAIIRNPFDHMLSYFFHCIVRRYFVFEDNVDLIKSFHNFVPKYLNDVHLRQSDYIKSNRGIKVKTFRYENLNLNRHLMKHHNLNLRLNKFRRNQGSKSNKASELKSNCGISIQQFYNKRITDMVVKTRRKEFKSFNYSTSVLDA